MSALFATRTSYKDDIKLRFYLEWNVFVLSFNIVNKSVNEFTYLGQIDFRFIDKFIVRTLTIKNWSFI